MSDQTGNGKVVDLTTEILISIRDEIRQFREETTQRLDATNQRIDVTNQCLDATNQRLDGTNRRLDATNQRLESTNERIDRLRSETRVGLKEVHDSLSMRLDKVIDNTGQHYRELQARLSRVELDVAELKRH
jgi:chromosome segregation ATPase